MHKLCCCVGGGHTQDSTVLSGAQVLRHDVVKTHGYVQEYRWAHAPAFEWSNVATIIALFRTFQPRRPSSAE